MVYGFLSMIVTITVFHILNTVRMGVSARARQYGIMRAVGMSSRHLTRMIAAEAAAYTVSGLLLGWILGLGRRRIHDLPLHLAAFSALHAHSSAFCHFDSLSVLP